MSTTDTTQKKLSIDTRLLSNFIIELNIARRHFVAYPPGHPLIVSALDKVMLILEQLLEFSSEVTLAVARDALMVGYAMLDRKNPVYRDFARTLFNHDIGVITFRKSLSREELHRFNEILTLTREEVRQRGGIEQVFLAAALENLPVKAINYHYFRTTEDAQVSAEAGDSQTQVSTVLWEHFAHGLLDGTLDPRGSSTSIVTGIEPEILAEMLNELEEKSGGKEESYAEVIASFVGHLEQSDSDVRLRREPMEKLSTFVSKLNPRLRRDFLNGAFASLESRPQLSEEFLTGLPEDLILETLEDINSLGSYVPPMIVTILQKLSTHATSGKRTGARALTAHPFDAATGQKLRVMFNEDDLDAYVPDSYQETLRSIALLDRLVVPDLEDVESLKETLAEHNIERQICWMLQDVMADPPDGQLLESVEQNLLELARYFLETGDFASLSEMYGRLKQDVQVDVSPESELRNFFTDPDVLEMILDGFCQWGKEKFDAIRLLIKHIGLPCVEPLMERLAAEQAITLRRAYLNALLDLGEVAREAAIARLVDGRWYVVRNIIVILRKLNDRNLMIHFRRLRNHPHPRVRCEILKTLQYYRDPEADRLLVQYMDGTERELRLHAITAAECSRSHAVFQKLLELMGKGGVAGLDYEIRVAALRTLAHMANCAAIPEIAKLLESKSRLRPALLNQLKAEALRSLAQYPVEAVLPVLAQAIDSGQPELANLAREIVQNLRGQKL